MKIILASASPRRSELLAQMGLSFQVEASNIKEDIPNDMAIEIIPQELAFQKAKDVNLKIKEPALIIGADTIVVKDKILGKPKSREEALTILTKLQGQTHKVITGLAIINTKTGKTVKDYVETIVEMAPIKRKVLEEYVKTGEPMDKAGAYGIQGLAGVFIKKIEGCYFNVVGLPIHKLWVLLNDFKIEKY